MPHVLIMGGGHCGEALSRSLDALGWTYDVHDTRSEFATDALYPHAVLRSHDSVSEFFSSHDASTLRKYSDVLLLGHDWSEDQARLLALLKRLPEECQLDGTQAPRIGVIGSRSKWQAFVAACDDAGIGSSLTDQVVCPIGLNIGADSPEEIAVAVTAQIMVLHKNVDLSQPSWRDSL